jgi:hypothetical protein
MQRDPQSSYNEIFKKIGQATSVLLQITSDAGEKINGILQTYHEPLESLAKHFSSMLDKVSLITIPLAEALVKEISATLSARYKLLAEEGWFCDIGVTKEEYSTFMKEVFFYHEASELSGIFKEYYASQLELIEQRLLCMYPERNRFITEAFDAHRTGKYLFSIPVFLSLADGITYLKTGDACLFTSSDKQPKIKQTQFMKDLTDESLLIEAMLSAVTNFSAINKPEKIDNNKFFLNRHTILHGKNLDYDTEINSLKVISLLNYLACLYKGWPSQD